MKTYLVKINDLSIIEEYEKRGVDTGKPKSFPYIRIFKGDNINVSNLRRDPRVDWVDDDYLEVKDEAWRVNQDLSLVENEYISPWGLDNLVSPDGFYKTNLLGENTAIIVMDDGVNTGHIDFQGRTCTRIYSHDDLDYTENDTHGTMCASQAVGNYSGVSKGATLLFTRLGTGEGGGFYSTEVIKGFDAIYAYVNEHPGPNYILSMSFSSDAELRYKDMLQSLYDLGVILVASAGNYDNAVPRYPAAHDFVIGVGAIDKSLTRAYWGVDSGSNYGPHVNIYAPGDGTLAAATTGPDAFTMGTGTSAAAPYVAGVIALICEGMSIETPLDSDKLKRILYEGSYRNLIQWRDPTDTVEADSINLIASPYIEITSKDSPVSSTPTAGRDLLFDTLQAKNPAMVPKEAFSLSLPVTSNELDYNTQVIVFAKKGSGFWGQKTIHYNRVTLNDHLGTTSISYPVNATTTLTDVKNHIINTYAVLEGDVYFDMNFLPTVQPEDLPYSVLLYAKEDSYLYLGNLEVILTEEVT